MALIRLCGPGLVAEFEHENDRLRLTQIGKQAGPALLHVEGEVSGPGPLGNPLTLCVRKGIHEGIYGIETFKVKSLTFDEKSLLAYLAHDKLPLELALQVEVEGNVATWRGQAGWNGNVELDAEFYFPLLSRVKFASPDSDRAIMPSVSGAVLSPLSTTEFEGGYLGGLSSPTFLVEGGGHGLAFLDDNRADTAADPAACVRRTQVVGHGMPPLSQKEIRSGELGTLGPYVGVGHGRLFRPISALALTDDDMGAELGVSKTLPLTMRGDVADFGPVRTYAYEGDWRVGATWLRTQRRHIPFRVPRARWFQHTTSISEDMGDSMVKEGLSFYDYSKLLSEKRLLGSDVFHIPGFHDAEVLGSSRNWQCRGDYHFAAQNLGGFEAARQGVESVHRSGGHVLYYLEGLIMWKRSRIGRSHGREWALMRSDGTYDEHYKGFWHMCPCVPEWREWLASTCADIVRDTGVDGFFIDSSCATNFHRCFNPNHHHMHPDGWDWGLLQMLRRIREKVDEVNPETVILVEGAGDMAREYVDGFLTHSHDWTGGKFNLPFVRFLYSDMRVYESWGGSANDPARWGSTVEAQHIWNFVTGHRVYAHAPRAEQMTTLSKRARTYHDAFPEICEAPLSMCSVQAENCLAELFESDPHVITVGNPTAEIVTAHIHLTIPGGILFDRVDGQRIPVNNGTAALQLEPWDLRAFEIRG